MHAPRETRVKTWLEKFLDAVSHGQLELAQDLIGSQNSETRTAEVQIGLRRALQIACSRSDEALVSFLLDQGASTDALEKEVPALIRAVEAGSLPIVKALLSGQSRPYVRRASTRSTLTPSQISETYRKAFFLAVQEGYHNITKELLDAGIHYDTRDKDGRTALAHLCAHRKDARHKHRSTIREQHDYGEVVQLLLEYGVDIEARGNVSRTALHWAVAREDEEMVTILLDGCNPKGANVDAVAIGKKTPLHIAAAKHSTQIVDLLLRHGADCKATSQGAWTPLHIAAHKGSLEILQKLLGSGADAEAVTDNGRTALHWAADNGHVDCVRHLIPPSGFKRHAKDSKGKSAWMLAAKKHYYTIMQLLSPFNNDEHLSPLARHVCEDYLALITDIHPQKRGGHKYISTEKRSMYDVLYAVEERTEKPKVTIRAKKDSVRKGGFRWIHLPANNTAWVEVLLTKYYMERGAAEVDAFQRAANFLNLQHRGNTVHSQYMKPSCQRILPRSGKGKEASDFLGDQMVDKWYESDNSVKGDNIQNEVRRSLKPIIELAALASPDKAGRSVKSPLKATFEDAVSPSGSSPVEAFPSARRPGIGGMRSPNGPESLFRGGRPSSRLSQNSLDRPLRHGEANTSLDFSELFLFMPYLHFESFQKSQKMSGVLEDVFKEGNPRKASTRAKIDEDEQEDLADVIKSAPLQERPFLEQMFYSAHDSDNQSISTLVTPSHPPDTHADMQNWPKDVMLIHAYLLEASPLHPRRTLDQFYYPTGNTSDRDKDQVVYRYYQKYGLKEPKVFMVDQLWLWILDKDLVITSFPYQWEQEDRDDSFDLAHAILDDIKDYHLSSVYDLASCITNRCSGMFYTNVNLEEYRFLEMFEQSIADLHDEEPELAYRFKTASKGAEKWFSEESKTVKNPTFDDYFTKVGKEMKLLTEAKDIQGEIDMISFVLQEQARIIPLLQDAVKDDFVLLKASDNKAELRTTFNAQVDEINGIIARLERMRRDVDEFYQSCVRLLNLKQQYAGVFEARYSRMQATSSVRQGHTIMVFTIVTVVFLPISFIATFFEIPVSEFEQSLTLSYVSKFIFIIGVIISIPLVILALTVDDISRWWHKLRQGQQRRESENDGKEKTASASKNTPAVHVSPTQFSSRETEFLRKHGGKHTHLTRHLLGGLGHDFLHPHQARQRPKQMFHPINMHRRVHYDEEKGNSE